MEDNILVKGIKKRRERSLEAAIDKYGPTVHALINAGLSASL